MLEVVVAIAIAAILSITMLALVVKSNSLGTSAKMRDQAAKYGEQALELVRSYKYKPTNKWSDLYTKADEQCHDPASVTLATIGGFSTNCTVIPIAGQTTFSWGVHLEKYSGAPQQEIIATAYVKYEDHGTTQWVKVGTYIADVQ